MPIYKGCEKPLMKDHSFDGYFGNDGISGHQSNMMKELELDT